MSIFAAIPVEKWKPFVKKALRNYQVKMCEAACGNNSIVVLPTGSGKTLIASALAAHSAVQGGRTLFLVPTQMLVAQQARAVEEDNYVGLLVAQYHGELAWPKGGQYHVLVSTPEAFRLKLASQEVRFADFTFVVFDEVHHVMKKHPYRKLARLLELEHPQPTILGLTATCTYSVEESSIKSDIRALCAALRISTILTASTSELVADGYHGATPQLQISTASTTSTTNTSDEDEQPIFDVYDVLPKNQDSKFMPHQQKESFFYSIEKRTADPLLLRLMDLTRLVEADVQKIMPSFSSPMDIKGKRGKVNEWSSFAEKLRVPQGIVLLHLYESLRLVVVTSSLAVDLVLEYLRMTIQEIHLRCLGNLAPLLESILWDGSNDLYTIRFKRLTDVLLRNLAKHNKSFRGILFVQQKLTTHILKHFIDRTLALSAALKTECIYATSGEASPTYRVTTTQSRERIAQFARGEVNLLISTAVAEEGMDVPAANCIIRFDPIQTPVSLIQGRGRARQEDSSFVVMEERQDRTVEKLGQAEHAQMNLLKNSKDVLGNPQEEERKRKLAQQSRDLSGKQLLKAGKGNSISLIKTFCQKTDREVIESMKKIGGEWNMTVSVLGFQGEKEITEVLSHNKKDAKLMAYNNMVHIYKKKYGLQ